MTASFTHPPDNPMTREEVDADHVAYGRERAAAART